MQPAKLKISAFLSLTLSVLILSPHAFSEEWPDETTEPSLHAMPVNSRAVKEQAEFYAKAVRHRAGFKDSQSCAKIKDDNSRNLCYQYGALSTNINVDNRSGELWPLEAIKEKQAICSQFDVGCNLIEYTDSEKLKDYPPTEVGAVDPSLMASEKMNDQEFFLDEFMNKISNGSYKKDQACHVWVAVTDKMNTYGSWVAGAMLGELPNILSLTIGGGKARYTKVVEKTEDCHALLKEHDVILSQNTISARADQAMNDARNDLSTGGVISKETETKILQNPYSFKELPNLYQGVLGQAKAMESLENVMQKAFWLTLESLTNSAFSRLDAFPYRKDDSVNPNNFLTADWAYTMLKNVERSTGIISLTPALRSSLSGGCKTDENCSGFARRTKNGRWYTVAAYVPNTNSFYIDFTQDFYETVYAFEHELWHAVTENTVESQHFRERVQDLAQLPVSDQVDLALKQTVFWSVIQNELHAIHESNLLYRFAGHLTHQWGGEAPSAKAWYDSEFGDEKLKHLYIPYTFRKQLDDVTKDGSEYNNITRDGEVCNASGLNKVLCSDVFFFSLPFAGGIIRDITFSHQHHQKETSVLELNKTLEPIVENQNAILFEILKSKVLGSLPPEVIALFSERYRLTLPDFKDFEQTDDLSKMKFQKPMPVRLTCDQANHIASLMPAEWEHGIPFFFEVTNGPCSIGDGSNPENAGSHPSINALPFVNALPCLNGGE